MTVMKILSPAGNFESLKMAVYNGADEVYLGINDFNARNNIDGFSMDNLGDAVDFSHVYGVKVCLAINILFSDSELQSALDTVIKAYNLGVDYFIVQDLGLAKLISENYPEIILHASTQMGIHNLDGVTALKEFGFSRVVLARETPLEEIKRIKENCDIEIEYFAQGALCVSFSGNCYLSSYLFNASGNRGRCKQLCRLPYTLLKGGKAVKSGYLLSAKDFNMTAKLEDLKRAGVDVIKIEGRARRPFYVATATREYKRALSNENANQDNLRLAFNREYTAGYFDGNGNIISELQNHIGIFVGRVERVKSGKNFNEVYFSSNRTLSPKSTFKVFCEGKEKSVLTAFDLKQISSGKYMLTTTQNLSVGNTLNLIVDAQKENETLEFICKRAVDVKISAIINEPIKAEVFIDGESFTVVGEALSEAQRQPLDILELKDNFNKNEYFTANIMDSVIDRVFMPKSKLNEFRRAVYARLYERLTKKYHRQISSVKVDIKKRVEAFRDFEFVESENANINSKNVIYSPEIYSLEKVMLIKERCEKEGRKLYLDTPNFALAKDIELLRDIVCKSGVGIVANNYYALGFDTEMVIGGALNVYNSITATYFDKPIITAEDGVLERTDFPFMTLRHCPIKSHVGGSCDKCRYEGGYEYKMESGKTLKLKRKKLSTCTFYLV